jgi:hypothetical protein
MPNVLENYVDGRRTNAKLYADQGRMVASFCVRSPTVREGIYPGIVYRMLALPDGRASDTETTPVYEPHSNKYSQTNPGPFSEVIMEVTKALAALRPLYGKSNIEIVTRDGHRVRGVVRSMKTTQALTTPSVKVERADGEIVKVPFSSIVEIINHNPRV